MPDPHGTTSTIGCSTTFLVKEKTGMKKNLSTADKFAAKQPTGNTIGLDLGDRWSRYCVLDQTGTIVKEDRVRTTLDSLKEEFGGTTPTRIVIEAGTHSPWVSRELQSQGHEVTIANARKVRLIYESDRKNDRTDAQMLARLGRVDVKLLSPIQHRSAEAQADLAVVRGRDALVAARTQLVNATRGIVKSMGGRLPTSTTAAFAGKVEPSIPSELKLALAPILKSIRQLSEQIQRCDRRIADLSKKKYPETKLLQQVSGIGPLISLTYVLTIEDPKRFPKSRTVGSYLGLRPKQSESGDSSPQLGSQNRGMDI
jgi:transposase